MLLSILDQPETRRSDQLQQKSFAANMITAPACPAGAQKAGKLAIISSAILSFSIIIGCIM
jgi:hypothetical protein